MPVRVEGIASLLAEYPDVDLVETVPDPATLHRAVTTHQPDAVLTDIRMPPTFTTEGIDAAKHISGVPQIGVAVLSQYFEEYYALELLADGVAGLGCLLKERVAQVEEFVRALHDVARGGSALDPKVNGLSAASVRKYHTMPASVFRTRPARPRGHLQPLRPHRAPQGGQEEGPDPDTR